MRILRYKMGDKKMSLSLNSNTVGWGCKLEALKDMGIHNSEYDALVKEMDMYRNLYSWSNSESFFNNDNDINGVDDLIEYDDLDETDLYLD